MRNTREKYWRATRFACRSFDDVIYVSSSDELDARVHLTIMEDIVTIQPGGSCSPASIRILLAHKPVSGPPHRDPIGLSEFRDPQAEQDLSCIDTTGVAGMPSTVPPWNEPSGS